MLYSTAFILTITFVVLHARKPKTQTEGSVGMLKIATIPIIKTTAAPTEMVKTAVRATKKRIVKERPNRERMFATRPLIRTTTSVTEMVQTIARKTKNPVTEERSEQAHIIASRQMIKTTTPPRIDKLVPTLPPSIINYADTTATEFIPTFASVSTTEKISTIGAIAESATNFINSLGGPEERVVQHFAADSNTQRIPLTEIPEERVVQHFATDSNTQTIPLTEIPTFNNIETPDPPHIVTEAPVSDESVTDPPMMMAMDAKEEEYLGNIVSIPNIETTEPMMMAMDAKEEEYLGNIVSIPNIETTEPMMMAMDAKEEQYLGNIVSIPNIETTEPPPIVTESPVSEEFVTDPPIMMVAEEKEKVGIIATIPNIETVNSPIIKAVTQEYSADIATIPPRVITIEPATDTRLLKASVKPETLEIVPTLPQIFFLKTIRPNIGLIPTLPQMDLVTTPKLPAVAVITQSATQSDDTVIEQETEASSAGEPLSVSVPTVESVTGGNIIRRTTDSNIGKNAPTIPPNFLISTPDSPEGDVMQPFAAHFTTQADLMISTEPDLDMFVPTFPSSDFGVTTDRPADDSRTPDSGLTLDLQTEEVMAPFAAENDPGANSVPLVNGAETVAFSANNGFEIPMFDGMMEGVADAGLAIPDTQAPTGEPSTKGTDVVFRIETATDIDGRGSTTGDANTADDGITVSDRVDTTGNSNTADNGNTAGTSNNADNGNTADARSSDMSGSKEMYSSQTQKDPSYTDIKNLYAYILNDYDKRVRPKFNQSQVTKVSVFFSLLNILDFKTATQTFDIVGYFYFVWQDEFLVWKPRHFSRTQWIKIPIKDIWTPQLLIANMYTGDAKIGDSTDRALVTFQGTVIWVPEATYRIVCEVEIEFYPFDTQTCRLTFYVSDELMSEVELFVDDKHQGSRTDHYMENSEWRLVKVSVEKYFVNDASYMDVTFTVQRRLEFIFITTIAPLLLVSVLNLCVFLIPVEAEQKGEYSATIVITYGVFISHISASVPPNSTTIPYFVLYMIWLLGFSVSTVIYSIIQSRLFTHYGKRRMGMSPFSICFGKKVKSKNGRTNNMNGNSDAGDTNGSNNKTERNSDLEGSNKAENKSHLWGDMLKKLDIVMILLYTASVAATTTYFFLSMNVSSYFQYI